MSYDSSKPFKVLHGEPVTKPDGFELELYRTQSDSIIVHLGRGPVAQFTSEDTVQIGEGSYDLGALRIGRAAFEVDTERFNNNDSHVLHRDLLPLRYA